MLATLLIACSGPVPVMEVYPQAQARGGAIELRATCVLDLDLTCRNVELHHVYIWDEDNQEVEVQSYESHLLDTIVIRIADPGGATLQLSGVMTRESAPDGFPSAGSLPARVRIRR